MSNRNASKLINYLGTETSVRLVEGAHQNVFVGGDGNDKAIDASSVNLSSSIKNLSAVNIEDYLMARTYLIKHGFDEKLAKTYALIVADIAKLNNVSIFEVLDESNGVIDFSINDLSMINLYREPSSRQSKVSELSNSNSYKSRSILP